MFDNQATGKKLSRRGRTAAVATSVGAALLAVGIGMTPAAADASSPRRVATAPTARSAAPGLGTDNLIPVGATVDLTGRQALSACSGETTMRTLTKGSASAYADVTWTFDSSGSFLTESVADGSTDASAVSYGNRLNKAVRSCQNEPTGHWYYGQGHALSVPAGEGTWYPAFNGDGKVTGGVAVIRGGHRFGIVELVGQPSDDPGYMKGLAAAAINRLTD
jgi:hypothetical protein